MWTLKYLSPGDVPGLPNNVQLIAESESSLRVQFDTPSNTKVEGSNGLPITGYKVDIAKRVDEIQTITVQSEDGVITGGAYQIGFSSAHGSDTSECIDWNASEVQMELALEQMGNIDGVGVTRSVLGAVPNGYIYSITFNGQYLVNGDQPNVFTTTTGNCLAFTPDPTKVTLTGANVKTGAAGAVPELWTITSTGNDKLRGSMKLSMYFEGDVDSEVTGVTVSINAGSSVATTTGSLIGVVNRGDRVKINGEIFKVHKKAPFTDLLLPLDSYHTKGTVAGSNLFKEDTALGMAIVTKGSPVVTTRESWTADVVVNDYLKIDDLIVKVAGISETTVTLNSAWTGETSNHVSAYMRKKTPAIALDADASQVQAALETLPKVGSIKVSRDGPDENLGYVWSVTFHSLNGETDCTLSQSPCLHVNDAAITNLAGTVCNSGDCDVTPVQIRKGIAATYSTNNVVASKEMTVTGLEVQEITVEATKNDLDGMFSVSFGSTDSTIVKVYINFDDTAKDVRAKLESLPTIGRVQVERVSAIPFGYTWTVSFLSNVGDLPLIKVDESLLTGTDKTVKVIETKKGQQPVFETILDGLSTGEFYSVQIRAMNAKGYGPSADSTPLSLAVQYFPFAVIVRDAAPTSSSQLSVEILPPSSPGSAIVDYQVELTDDDFSTPQVTALQILNHIENDIIGTFRLQYGAYKTRLLNVQSSANEIQSALLQLRGLNDISVSRSIFIFTGHSSDKVSKFDAETNTLTCTPLTQTQVDRLQKGTNIEVLEGTNTRHTFTIAETPEVSATVILVNENTVVSFTTTTGSVLQSDTTGGVAADTKGYEWQITFSSVIGSAADLTFVDSTLKERDTGTVQKAIAEKASAGNPSAYYMHYKLSNSNHCNSYVIGSPSAVQYLQISSATTAITKGGYKLQLGDVTTGCINIEDGQEGLRGKLQEKFGRVSVKEERGYKKVVLDGTSKSIKSYDSATGTLTASSVWTTDEVALLLADTRIRVSRTSGDASLHSCDFTVTASAGAETLEVSGVCDSFSDEIRSLSLHSKSDYKVTFWGMHSDKQWPTLSIDWSNYGTDICDTFKPSAPTAEVHSILAEGPCVAGNAEKQTIVAEGNSALGGDLIINYKGKTTNRLPIQTTTASDMKAQLDKIASPQVVSVRSATYGTHGKAWHVTFVPDGEESDQLIANDAFVSGLDAVVNVFPTVTIESSAQKDNIRGTFRIFVGKEQTERLAHCATSKKVMQELNKLKSISRIGMLGNLEGKTNLNLKVTTTEGSATFTDIKYDNQVIDPSLYLAPGDTITANLEDFTILSVSSTSIGVSSNFVGTSGEYDANAGDVVQSMKQLPGLFTAESTLNVVTATQGQSTMTFPANHGFTKDDRVSINGQELVINSVDDQSITMTTNYLGDDIAASTPKVSIFKNRIKTTVDLKTYLNTEDKIWIQVGDDQMSEFVVKDIVSSHLDVAGIITKNVVKHTAFQVANGFSWSVVFKSHTTEMTSVMAVPDSDWRGTEARIKTILPYGTQPNSINIGNLPEIQKVVLNAQNGASDDDKKYYLRFRETNTEIIEWSDSADGIETKLEALNEIHDVSVDRNELGNMLTLKVTFFGMYDVQYLEELVCIPAVTSKVSTSFNIIQHGLPDYTSHSTYLSLKNSQLHKLRITARNQLGYGPLGVSTSINTAIIATLPSLPQSVILGKEYGKDWLSVHYSPPHSDGGSDLHMYRLEWDSSPAFNVLSANYGTKIIERKAEIQKVVTSFRSADDMHTRGGTFTLRWGGRVSAALAFDCTESDMVMALKSITNTLDASNDAITVTRSSLSYGYAWSITFHSIRGDISPLIANSIMLEGDNPTISVTEIQKGVEALYPGAFTYEVQEIYTQSNSELSGKFHLSFEGKVTEEISVGASALEVQNTLQALSSIHLVKVEKEIIDSSIKNELWTVTFAHLNHELINGAGNIHLLRVHSTNFGATVVSPSVQITEKIRGSNPLEIKLDGLETGSPYYLRVMAYNVKGFGSASSPISSATPRSHPGLPTVLADVVDATSVKVTWTEPADINGNSIDEYRVEWYRKTGTNEELTITTSAEAGIPEIQTVTSFADDDSIGGYFRLSFDDQVSPNLKSDASAAEVQSSLHQLSSIGTVEVSRQYSKRSVGGLLVVSDSSDLKILNRYDSSDSIVGVSINDQIWVGGTEYTVGSVSNAVITLTESLPSKATSPMPVFKRSWGYSWSVTFLAGHNGPQPTLKALPSDNWAGANVGLRVDVTQKGLQPIEGTFSVTMEGGDVVHSSPALAYDISAFDMKNALQDLIPIGSVDVTRVVNGYGYNWVVTFITDVKINLGSMTINPSGLSGPSAGASVATMITGVDPEGFCEVTGAAASTCYVTTDPTQRSATISSLTTGAPYQFRVRAKNSEGWGEASTIAYQTPRSAPDDPTSVELIIMSSTMLKVKWAAPLSNGGATISHYLIEWDTSSSFANVGTPDYDYFIQQPVPVPDDDAKPYHYNIPIHTTEPYYVRVYAINDQGKSGPSISTPAHAIPLNRVPGPPVDLKLTVLSNYGLHVEWSVPDPNLAIYGGNGGQGVTQYLVEWDTNAAFITLSQHASVASTERGYVIGGHDVLTGVASSTSMLSPDTKYYVRVTAFNSYGASVATEALSATTADQVPGVPREVVTNVVSANSASVSWTHPTIDGGQSIASYDVYWDSQEDELSGQAGHVSLPVVREMQTISTSATVTNEEQYLEATVEVTNERQTIRTSVTGVDEVQIIRTYTDSSVVDEIQTVTTTATDEDEVQEIRITADDVNEIQTITSVLNSLEEIQKVKIYAPREHEVQELKVTFSGVTGTTVPSDSTITLSYNSDTCTYCSASGTQEIAGISLTDDGADMLSKVASLTSDDVSVAYAAANVNGGADLVITFAITFTGNGNAGDIPELDVKAITASGLSPTSTVTTTTQGNEPKHDSSFKLKYACEQYSDPTSETGVSTACSVKESTLCDDCATTFSSNEITTTSDLTSSLSSGDHFRVHNCVFQVDTISVSKITVKNDVGVGRYCTEFSGKTYAIYKNEMFITADIPIKSASDEYTATSVLVERLEDLSAIGTVTVSRELIVESDKVGVEYAITFHHRSGSLPLLEVDVTNLKVTTDDSNSGLFAVTRFQEGSRLRGTFTLKLGSGGTQTTALPWDTSAAEMKTALEAASFGDVEVTRTPLNFETDSKRWSGEYKWTIEFTTLGGNVDNIVVAQTFDGGNNPGLTQATQRQGNEVVGSFYLALDGVSSTAAFTVNDLTSTFVTRMASVAGATIVKSEPTQAKGYTFTVTFTDSANGGDVSLMAVPSHTLTGQNVKIEIVETTKGNELGGTFQLQFDGHTTGPILFNAEGSDVALQLNSLPSIHPSSVAVTRTGPDVDGAKQVKGYIWSITFQSSTWADPTSDHSSGISGNWKGPAAKWDDTWPSGYSKAWGKNVGPLSSNGKSLSCITSGMSITHGTVGCSTVAPQAGVGPVNNGFTIRFDTSANVLPSGSSVSHHAAVTSATIAHNAWASRAESEGSGIKSVEEILEDMANVGDVEVSRSAVDPTTGGYTWTVTFLRDVDGPCEQVDSVNQLCNSPGNVPTMTAPSSDALLNVEVCGYAQSGDCSAFNSVCQEGVLLRGDFANFRVTGDPGVIQGCNSCVTGKNSVVELGTNIDADTLAALQKHLKSGDQFKVDTCVFTVATDGVKEGTISIDTNTCTFIGSHSIQLVLPWNAETSLVERALESASDGNGNTGIWSNGRQVSVERTIHGKYGEVSWLVRFISNPGQTPPGAGDVPVLDVTSSDFNVNIIETQKGSIGLSGNFEVDFHSAIGARSIAFNEAEQKLEYKLEEMTTVGDVEVRKYEYPSSGTGCTSTSCSGGWEDKQVDIDGTRGGYRWAIRFLKNPDSYLGKTFPPGSGNVDTLTTTSSSLAGNGKIVEVKVNTEGSAPLEGVYNLVSGGESTPDLPYSSSATHLKQSLEQLSSIGAASVEVNMLSTYRIETATASIAQDAKVATISNLDDIRNYLAPGDVIRFGDTATTTLAGANGDSFIAGTEGASSITTVDDSPLITSTTELEDYVYPGQQIRIDGSVYTIKRTGMEIQQVRTDTTDFKLKFVHGAETYTSDCIISSDTASEIQTKLRAMKSPGGLDITVTSLGNKVYNIYFAGPTTRGNVNELSAVQCDDVGQSVTDVSIETIVEGGPIAHQKLTLATNGGTVNDDAGYFKLKDADASNEITPCIKWGASASSVKASIAGLAAYTPDDLYVSRHGDGVSVTEIQRLAMTSNIPVSGGSGFFKLSFQHDGTVSSTNCLDYGITAADMQSEIDGLTNIDSSHVSVSRSGDASATWGYGYEYTFIFSGLQSSSTSSILGNVEQFTTNVCSSPTTGYPSLRMDTLRDGAASYEYDIFYIGAGITHVTTMIVYEQGTASCASGWTHTGGGSRNVRMQTVTPGGGYEVQTVTVNKISDTPDEQFKLSFDAAETDCMSYNVDAATMASKLISILGANSVQVTAYDDPAYGEYGKLFRITFIGESVRGDVPELKMVNDCSNSITESTTSVVVDTVTGAGTSPKEIVLTEGYKGESPGSHIAYVVGQTFKVMESGVKVQKLVVEKDSSFSDGASYSISYDSDTVAGVKWDSTEEELEAKIASLSGINANEVMITRRADAVEAPNGYVYSIYFSSGTVKTSANLLSASSPTEGSVEFSTIESGFEASEFTANTIPLASLSSASTSASYLGTATSLGIYKVNGFLSTVKFDKNLGNVAALTSTTSKLKGSVSIQDNFVTGSIANTYALSDLNPGVQYYVKVAARSSVGRGAKSKSVQIIPSSTPDAPLNTEVGASLHVDEQQVVTVAATHVNEVQVIKTSASVISEVQTVTVTADPCANGNCVSGGIHVRFPSIQTVKISANAVITSGTYKLIYGTASSDSIGWNASPDDFKSALEDVTGIGTNSLRVTRQGDASAAFNYGYIYSVTFVGSTVRGEVATMTSTDLTGDLVTVAVTTANPGLAMGTDTEIQQIVVKADKILTTGAYKLDFDSQTSECVNFDASASRMKDVLESLTNIDKVHVTRSTDAEVAPNGYVYSIVFYGNAVAGDVQQIGVSYNDCDLFQTLVDNQLISTGVNGAVAVTTIDDGGEKSIFYSVASTSASTAAQLKADLNQLPIIGNVETMRSLKDDQGGHKYTVIFSPENGDVAQLICSTDDPNENCDSSTVTGGNVLSGNFILDSSTSIPYNADETTLKTKLEAMTAKGSVAVSRTGPNGQNGYTWSVTFLTIEGDVPALTATDLLDGVGHSITISEKTKGNYLGGDFKLAYGGYTTEEISYSANADTLKTKLEALATIGSVQVSQSEADSEGGSSWTVTFIDNVKNAGDLASMIPEYAGLTGQGTVVTVRELTKGADAVGNRLWVSFDPPASDSGSDIIGYSTEWDTVSTFNADPKEYTIEDPDLLYSEQYINTKSSSLAWSQTLKTEISEVQTISIPSTGTFKLKFREETIKTDITVDTTTVADVKNYLEALSTITTVTVSGDVTSSGSGAFLVTFTGESGPLPNLVPTESSVTVAETIKGVTNFRKEAIAFTCSIADDNKDVKFTVDTVTATVKATATLVELKNSLESLPNIPLGGISVTTATAQTSICADSNPGVIKIIFHYSYGDLDVSVASSDSADTDDVDTIYQIDGIYYKSNAHMTGTFTLKYKDAVTQSLGADSSASDVRAALENLSSMTTVRVSKDYSRQALSGKVAVVKGQHFVTCATGETCDFAKFRYGIPGERIFLGESWYTVLSDTTSASVPSDRLYLGSVASNQPVTYAGETASEVIVYESARGFSWKVSMLQVSEPLEMIQPQVHHLTPASTSSVSVTSQRCTKCYYIPQDSESVLAMGETYHVRVHAKNAHGLNTAPSTVVSGIPREIPNAPSNVDLKVVSGTEIEVFFSPPALAPVSVDPNYNDDITSYLVQWDTASDFKHNLELCPDCVSDLEGNTLTVTKDLQATLKEGAKFTTGDASTCVYTVASVDSSSSISVNSGHGCTSFSERKDALKLYTVPPATVSGLSITGSPPYRHLITGLAPSTRVYVRVAAVNSVQTQIIDTSGRTNRKWSSPLSSLPQDKVSDAPMSVSMSVQSGTSLELEIEVPLRDGKGTGGSAITHYVIDVDSVSSFDSASKAPVNEVAVAALPFLYSGGPRVHYITGLNAGTTYYVSVKAKNSVGTSIATIASNSLAPYRAPDAPSNVKLASVASHATAMDFATITWEAPVNNGGLALSNYKVEWYSDRPRDEIQVVEITWTSDSLPENTFTLAYGGSTTTSFTFDVAPENVRHGLMATLGLEHVEVSRSAINADKGYQWTITFRKTVGNLPLIQMATSTPLSEGVSYQVYEDQAGLDSSKLRETQVVVTGASAGVVTGYFRLRFQGSTWTSYLPASASASAVKDALEQLPTVGQVTVTETSKSIGKYWTVTFDSKIGNQPVMIADGSLLTSTAEGATVTINVKDGDNLVNNVGKPCLPNIDACPSTLSNPWTDTSEDVDAIATIATIGTSPQDYGAYESSDASTLSYTIHNLIPGRTYVVKVSAKNILGYGLTASPYSSSVTLAKQAPGAPTSVALSVHTGMATSLKCTWNPPLSDGGDPILKYRVQWDRTSTFDLPGSEEIICPTLPTRAVWKVTTDKGSSVLTSGSFGLKLTRASVTKVTAAIPFNAEALAEDESGSSVFCSSGCPGSMQSKLEHLEGISQVHVTREALGDGAYAWTVTFIDSGDDFALEVDISPTLNDGGTVSVTQLISGTSPGACSGTHVIPSDSLHVLEKGKLYYARVLAYNAQGWSPVGLAGAPEKPQVPPGAPTDVLLQVLSISELQVIFSPPEDDGGDAVTEYEVEWSTSPGFSPSTVLTHNLLSGGAPFYRTIPGLAQGTKIYVRVRARNSQGPGASATSSPSSLNPHTTPGVVSNVRLGVTASSLLTVSWNAPQDDGGDAVSGYVVEWDISSGFQSVASAPHKGTFELADAHTRATTLSNLTPGQTYFVRVSAKNTKGRGVAQASTPASASPENVLPGKPHTISVTPTSGAGELHMSWQPPRIPFHGFPCGGTLASPAICPFANGVDGALGGVTLQPYEIEWSVDGTFTSSGQTVKTTSTTYTLTGLLSNQLYYVRVLASNSKGIGAFCAHSNSGNYLCPNNLELPEESTFVTGTPLSATTA